MNLFMFLNMLSKLFIATSFLNSPARFRSFSVLASRNKSVTSSAGMARANAPVLPSFTDTWPMQLFSPQVDAAISRLFTDSLAPRMAARLELDIKETPESLEIQVDTPGIKKEDIKIVVNDHILTISAEKRGMKKTDDEHFHRVERFSGHVSRSLSLPFNALEEKITATSDHGVLHITIPKNKDAEKEGECGKIIEIK